MNLDEQELDEFAFEAPKLYGPAEWTKLRSILTFASKDLDYFHYFGHGSPDSIGSGTGGAMRIILPTLQSGRLRHTPLTYAAIDGCRTGEDTAFLKALVGHAKAMSRQQFRAKGRTPRYAAGWDSSKRVSYILQGELYWDHFDFWVDYYNKLTECGGDGYMIRTYEEAYAFAKNPNGAGVKPSRQANPEADGFVQVGCKNCFFDE